jgi:hypothetical protein
MTRAKKEENGFVRHSVRPGDLVVESRELGKVAVGNGRTSGLLVHFGYVLESNVPYIVQAYSEDCDLLKALREGRLHGSDADEAVVAEELDITDGRRVYVAMNGKEPEISSGERLLHWSGIVIDRSLANAIVRVAEAWGAEHRGDLEMSIAKRLVECYDRSFIERRASQQPWLTLAEQMIREGEQIREAQPQLAAESEVI